MSIISPTQNSMNLTFVQYFFFPKSQYGQLVKNNMLKSFKKATNLLALSFAVRIEQTSRKTTTLLLVSCQNCSNVPFDEFLNTLWEFMKYTEAKKFQKLMRQAPNFYWTEEKWFSSDIIDGNAENQIFRKQRDVFISWCPLRCFYFHNVK